MRILRWIVPKKGTANKPDRRQHRKSCFKNGNEISKADDMMKMLETIGYEVARNISKRVSRIDINDIQEPEYTLCLEIIL